MLVSLQFRPEAIASTSQGSSKHANAPSKTTTGKTFWKLGNREQESNAAAILSQIQRSAGIDTANVVSQFRMLNRDIRRFCDKFASSISRTLSGGLPQGPYEAYSQIALSKPRWNFPSNEDYLFFAFLSIINAQFSKSIFRPFHPSHPEDQAGYRYRHEITGQKSRKCYCNTLSLY